jgi:hypothetical protein
VPSQLATEFAQLRDRDRVWQLERHPAGRGSHVGAPPPVRLPVEV